MGMTVLPAAAVLLTSVHPMPGLRKVPFDFAQGRLFGALGALLRDDIGEVTSASAQRQIEPPSDFPISETGAGLE